ncbi:MAG TPA: hypothetical protein VGB85_15180 [Nannocystis sp.]
MTRLTAFTFDLRRALGRRHVLGMLGGSGALLVVGCGDGGDASDASTGAASTGDASSSGDTSTGGTSTGATSTGTPTTGGSDTGSDTGSSTGDPTTGTTGPVECGGPAAAWATGGTASMTAQGCYPDPFSGGVLSCALICETTAGPCTTATTIDRRDVSEGFLGLPVRLALLIVDADTCAPIPGAQVEIWHTQRTGVYSGITPSPKQCYVDDPAAATFMYFRGIQTAGADGRIDFDTCFPGWYGGRAIHIHFRVIRDGQTYATSQLFFADELNTEVFATHPEYSEFGLPDITNQSDGIIGGAADMANYLLDTARMPDGAMLASKVIAVRSSLQDPSCTV